MGSKEVFSTKQEADIQSFVTWLYDVWLLTSEQGINRADYFELSITILKRAISIIKTTYHTHVINR